MELPSQPIGLFDRLPKEIFRPLASENRQRMWDLLVRLHNTFFGPDAAQAATPEFPRRQITLEIERYIQDCQDWISEDGQAFNTPISVRANLALDRLISSGWLREETIGVRKKIVMPPTVQKFLEVLQQFAEEGPKLVGGKVQVIYNNLQAIERDPAGQAAALHETAAEARRLLSSLSSTSVRVREVMERLNAEDSTAGYVTAFFRDYISAIYIRDYHEMRTQNHPLRHRHDILRIARQLRDSQATRQALIDGYIKSAVGRTPAEAEAHFERDITRLLKFEQIQAYLDRLDESITKATRQALSFIHYKLRTHERIEGILDQGIEVLTTRFSPDAEVPTPFAPGPLFSAERLREPNRHAAEHAVTAIRQSAMTPEQRARSELRRAMVRARQVTRKQIQQYAETNIAIGSTVTASDLPITCVSDLVIFMALSRASFLVDHLPPREQRDAPLLRAAHGLRFKVLGGRAKNRYVDVPDFSVTRIA